MTQVGESKLGMRDNKDDQGSAGLTNTDDEDYADSSGSGFQDNDEEEAENQTTEDSF